MSCLRVRSRLYAKAVKMGLRDGGEGWLPRYAIQWRGGEGAPRRTILISLTLRGYFYGRETPV